MHEGGPSVWSVDEIQAAVAFMCREIAGQLQCACNLTYSLNVSGNLSCKCSTELMFSPSAIQRDTDVASTNTKPRHSVRKWLHAVSSVWLL